MNTLPIQSHRKFIVTQSTHNTTSWIGHHKTDPIDNQRGQTFLAPLEADLEAIEVFTNLVTHPGEMAMTIHQVDESSKTWGPALVSASIHLDCDDSGKWKSIHIAGPHLKKGECYGFRLECPNSYIGLGEAIFSNSNLTLINGQEWTFTNIDKKGFPYSYFSLAFRVEARA
jgi:hypothetical protein